MTYKEKKEKVLSSDILTITTNIMPDGEVKASEFLCLNPNRPDNKIGSLKININTGLWSDFATNSKGGDIISWVSYINNIKYQDAVSYIYNNVLSLSQPVNNDTEDINNLRGSDIGVKKIVEETVPTIPVVKPHIAIKKTKVVAKSVPNKYVTTNGIDVILTDSPIDIEKLPAKADPTFYKAPNGKYALTVYRVDKEDGSKSIGMACTTADGIVYKHIDGNRPLYNIDKIIKSNKPVLFVEGEKCAKTAEAVLGDRFTVTTLAGGSNAFDKTDWTPLINKELYIWPDNDEPGYKLANRIVEELPTAKIVDIPSEIHNNVKGFDFYDYIVLNMDKTIIDHIKIIYNTLSIKKTNMISNHFRKMTHTDVWMADYLKMIEPNIMYVGSGNKGEWYSYSDGIWDRAEASVYKRVVNAIHALPTIFRKMDIENKENIKYYTSLLNTGRIKAVLEALRNDMRLATFPDERKGIFNFKRESYNCLTGKLSIYKKTDYLTHKSSISYREGAKCPKWISFLNDIFQGDKDKIRYIQQLIGYSMTGMADREFLVFLKGEGRNGKSLMVEILEKLFGDYSYTLSSKALLSNKFSANSSAPSPEMAGLKGKKIVFTTESSGGYFDAALVKSITSGDTITARKLHKDSIQFSPTHVLWVMGNESPVLNDASLGMSRRYKEINFPVIFDGKKSKASILNPIFKELEGIAQWGLEGIKDYRENGFKEPKEVTDIAIEKRLESDPVKLFLDECTEKKIESEVKAIDLYSNYRHYSIANGYRPKTMTGFGVAAKRHIKKHRILKGMYYMDIKMTTIFNKDGHFSTLDSNKKTYDSVLEDV